MTDSEFAKIIAYVGVAVGKPLAPEALEVYFDLLKHLPYDVAQLAARRVASQHHYANFPLPVEFLEAAAAIACPETELTPATAWELAWRAARDIDLDMNGPHISSDGKLWGSQAESILAGLPPAVVDAMRAYSLPALCYGEEPVGVIRGQFLKIFEQQAGTRRRVALLPPALRPGIMGPRKPLAPAVVAAIEGIGHECGN